MRKRFLIIGTGLGLLGYYQFVPKSLELRSNLPTTQKSIEAIIADKRKAERETILINPYYGGLDFPPTFYDDLIMSPMEYGLLIYHGNKRKRGNRLRFPHNAKLKRRMK